VVRDNASSVSVRKLSILALLAAPDSRGRVGQPILGITRLQKLVFLVSKRLGRTSPSRELAIDFSFVPEKFGPADLSLYPDLEFLEALGHVERRPKDDDLFSGSSTIGPSPSDSSESALSFEYLMGDEAGVADLSLAEEQAEQYRLTDKGTRALNQIISALDGRSKQAGLQVVSEAQRVRAEFGDMPLQRLLGYVYRTYPEMTTMSTIRDRVLGFD
jgi:hypothetical protein